MFNYDIKLRNRSKVSEVLGLKLSDKNLLTLLKEFCIFFIYVLKSWVKMTPLVLIVGEHE